MLRVVLQKNLKLPFIFLVACIAAHAFAPSSQYSLLGIKAMGYSMEKIDVTDSNGNIVATQTCKANRIFQKRVVFPNKLIASLHYAKVDVLPRANFSFDFAKKSIIDQSRVVQPNMIEDLIKHLKDSKEVITRLTFGDASQNVYIRFSKTTSKEPVTSSSLSISAGKGEGDEFAGITMAPTASNQCGEIVAIKCVVFGLSDKISPVALNYVKSIFFGKLWSVADVVGGLGAAAVCVGLSVRGIQECFSSDLARRVRAYKEERDILSTLASDLSREWIIPTTQGIRAVEGSVPQLSFEEGLLAYYIKPLATLRITDNLWLQAGKAVLMQSESDLIEERDPGEAHVVCANPCNPDAIESCLAMLEGFNRSVYRNDNPIFMIKKSVFAFVTYDQRRRLDAMADVLVVIIDDMAVLDSRNSYLSRWISRSINGLTRKICSISLGFRESEALFVEDRFSMEMQVQQDIQAKYKSHLTGQGNILFSDDITTDQLNADQKWVLRYFERPFQAPLPEEVD